MKIGCAGAASPGSYDMRRPFSLSASWRVRTAAVLAFLTVVVAAALAWSVWDAGRSHRAVARSTVRDHASFAATIMASNAEAVLGQTLLYAFYRADLADRTGSTDPVPPSALADNPPEARRCTSAYPEGRWFARVNAEGAIEVFGPLEGGPRSWLADTLSVILDSSPAPSPYGNLFPAWQPATLPVAYRIRRDSAGIPLEAHALAHCFETSEGPLFPRAREQSPLLPPSLVGDRPVDSLLAIEVRTDAGETVYRSPVSWDSEFRGVTEADTVGPMAGLGVRVILRSEVADQLVAGGIPGSRLPQAALLLVLAAGLVAATLVEIRRSMALIRVRERFVADVSHELRTPLQQILIFAQLLRMGELGDEGERSKALEVVETETLRLIRLVERVLTFARPEEAESQPSDPPPVSLPRLVEETVAAFRPLAKTENAEVRIRNSRDPILARVPPEAFRQVLLNLLENAVRYGPPEQEVTVGLARDAGSAVLTVDDQGPGVPAGERDQIWEPFYRLAREGSAVRSGSGIGLAIVRRVVTELGGAASVEEAPGGGARFVTSFPLADSDPAQRPRDAPP